eukprot:UN29100
MKKFYKNQATSHETVFIDLEPLMEAYNFCTGRSLLRLQIKLEELYHKLFYPKISDRPEIISNIKKNLSIYKSQLHANSFLSGLLSGLTVGIIITSSVLFNFFASMVNDDYMFQSITDPFIRSLIVICISLYLWSLALYTYRKFHINHSYILEFRHDGTLTYVKVFKIASLLFGLTTSFCVLNIIYNSVWFYGSLFIGLLCFVFLPLEYLLHKTRWWFLNTLGEIMISPATPVK